MKEKTFVLNAERNVTLRAFIQPVGGEFSHIARRPAILVLPGGGYTYCSDREAEPAAYPYLEAGYQAFVLRYSVKENFTWENAVEDYERAMELIAAHAEEWHIFPDRIAVIGFSAGGHFAACAASFETYRPAAAVLCYPATSSAFFGQIGIRVPDAAEMVRYDTCPCFVFATRDDNMVPVENSLRFLSALDRYGIAFETHIYSCGPHGITLGDSSLQLNGGTFCPRAPQWVRDSIGWLKDVLGDFTRDGGMTKPVCPAHVSEDGAAFLSADCTLSLLNDVPVASKILSPLWKRMEKSLEAYGVRLGLSLPADQLYVAHKGLTLRQFLKTVGAEEGLADEEDAVLRTIPNPYALA